MTRLSLMVRLFLLRMFCSVLCVWNKYFVLVLCRWQGWIISCFENRPQGHCRHNRCWRCFRGRWEFHQLFTFPLQSSLRSARPSRSLRVHLRCRFPVSARPGETSGSVREGRTLRCQHHHPKSGVHLPGKTRLQMKHRRRLFTSKPHSALTNGHYFTNPILN